MSDTVIVRCLEVVIEVNANFDRRALVNSDTMLWTPSPMPGVHRRMLDRLGDEVARATSLVRYAPGSEFSTHVHDGGEEFFVLDGVFQDEHGSYPKGHYIRNPPTSSHRPSSIQGCTIFVKLWQFAPADRNALNVNMDALELRAQGAHPGVSSALLFEDSRERVSFEYWGPRAQICLDLPLGAELFVLEGSFEESGDSLGRHAWLRLPKGGVLRATAGSSGAKVWLKTGHLGFVERPQMP